MYAFFWGIDYESVGGMCDYQGVWPTVDEIKLMVDRYASFEGKQNAYLSFWGQIVEIAPDGLNIVWSYSTKEGWTDKEHGCPDKNGWSDFSSDQAFEQLLARFALEQEQDEQERRRKELIAQAWADFRRAVAENQTTLRNSSYAILLQTGEIDRATNNDLLRKMR